MPLQSFRKTVSFEEAEGIALTALAFLAADRIRLTGFLDATGLWPERLRAEAGAPGTLTAVLDHLLADESLLMVFTSMCGLDAASIAPARAALAAGESRRAPEDD
jgi:hypothetical protein